MPINFREYLLLAKEEATPGTAETLAGTEGVFNIIDTPSITRNIPKVDIPGQNSLGFRQGAAGARRNDIAFSLFAMGKGSAALPEWASTFLPSCDVPFTSLTGAPVRGTTKTCTLARFMGSGSASRKETIVGAKGNAVFSFTAGAPARVNFSFAGCYSAAADATPPSVTHPTVIPPRWANAAGFSIGGTAFNVGSCEFDMGNNVILLPSPNGTSGYAYAWIPNRDPRIRVDLTGLDFGTRNDIAIYLASTQAQIILTLGTTTNNIITITAPACELVTPPSDNNRDGVLADQLEFRLCQNGDTEDSEYTIVFS
jgi:hypothetical protein